MKNTTHIIILFLGLAFASFAFSAPSKKSKVGLKTKTTKSKMQVEEPATPVGGAVSNVSAKNSKKQHAPAVGLTKDQKLAFRVRKEKMDQMITLITKKRLAMQAAKPEERVALARELHRLIIEQNVDGTGGTMQARVLTSVPTNPITIPKATPLPSVKTEISP